MLKIKIHCGTNLGVTSCYEVGIFDVEDINDAHKIARNRLKSKGFDIDKFEEVIKKKNDCSIHQFIDNNIVIVEYCLFKI